MPFAAWIGLALPAVKDGEDRRGLPDAVDFCCFSLAPSQEISIRSRACESTSLGDISAEFIVSSSISSKLLLNCESSLGMHADRSMLVIAGHGFFSTDKMAAVQHNMSRSSSMEQKKRGLFGCSEKQLCREQMAGPKHLLEKIKKTE